MANSVFRIDSSVPARKVPLEVYRDISIDADRNMQRIKYDFPEFSAYYAVLKAGAPELPSFTELSVVCKEPQDIASALSAIAIVKKTGFDEEYAKWEAFASQSPWKIGKLINVEAVKNALHQIFTWIPGERILNPEFGSRLRLYLYEGITAENVERIIAEIRHCVQVWEPRINVVSI